RSLPPPRSSLFPYTTLCRSLGVAQERRARALDLVRPTGEHVAAVRELQRPLGVLLDHQYCYARLVDLGNLLEDHVDEERRQSGRDRKSTRLNSSHVKISYAV